MIKWIVAIQYKPDQSKEACRQYWIEQHGRLALELAGLKHYAQSHRVLGEEDIGNAPYDGFESLWFENEAVAKQALASPGMAALEADADHFADPAGTKQEQGHASLASKPLEVSALIDEAAKAVV